RSIAIVRLISAAEHLRALRDERSEIVVEPRHRLREALVGAVFANDARALLDRRELAVPGQPGLAVPDILERHGLGKAHRLDIFGAVVAIDDSFRCHDLVEGNAVLIIAPVRPVHDEPPDATGTKVEGMRCSAESVRTPPLHQMLWICPDREDERPRRSEHTRADDRVWVAVEADAISCRPVASPVCVASADCAVRHPVCFCTLAPGGSADSRRGGRDALPRACDIPRASRRLPSMRALRCGTDASARRACA